MLKEDIGKQVHDFYQGLHFNESSDMQTDMEVIRGGSLVRAQLMPTFLQAIEASDRTGRFLEVGSGIGWLSLSVEQVFPHLQQAAIDYSDRALKQFRALHTALASRITVKKLDILDPSAFSALGQFDFVVSIGVLHHTANFATALKHTLAAVAPGGHVQLGLYHKYRRKPFLEHFRLLKEGGASLDRLRAEYCRLDQRKLDPTRMESWFLDQVMHPHETQHTVAEVMALACSDFRHVANSVTRSELPDRPTLEAREKALGQDARQLLVQGKYDPGFFVVHLQRKAD